MRHLVTGYQGPVTTANGQRHAFVTKCGAVVGTPMDKPLKVGELVNVGQNPEAVCPHCYPSQKVQRQASVRSQNTENDGISEDPMGSLDADLGDLEEPTEGDSVVVKEEREDYPA